VCPEYTKQAIQWNRLFNHCCLRVSYATQTLFKQMDFVDYSTSYPTHSASENNLFQKLYGKASRVVA
jgi:hypothetical protein